VAVFQEAAPNIEAARNQCVRMAHANVMQYLENEVNIAPLGWDLPQAQIRGFGQITAAGDTFTWQPVPENSVIANVDTRTTRSGVFSADTGGGSDRCKNIRGLLGYLNQSNLGAIIRHQGGAEIYGSGGSCDSWIFSDVADLYSTREGAHPTWEWIYEQLSLGRGVSISYSRYDPDGTYSGDHMLRVWGASLVNGFHYLHLLDDGEQGSNNSGLRLRKFEVHSPEVMDELKTWMEQQLQERLVEPNSRLGGASAYLLKRWKALTRFLHIPGAPLDNNTAERELKIILRYRKNSLFYKNAHGAYVGDVLTRPIETCRLNGINPLNYLRALMESCNMISPP